MDSVDDWFNRVYAHEPRKETRRLLREGWDGAIAAFLFTNSILTRANGPEYRAHFNGVSRRIDEWSVIELGWDAAIAILPSMRKMRETTTQPEKRPRGETLGSGLPDWPDDLNTFAERMAYQRGVYDARHLAPEGMDVKRMRHIANEWADMACNGIQWLHNIKEGISTADEALANMAENLRHCQEVNEAKSGEQK